MTMYEQLMDSIRAYHAMRDKVMEIIADELYDREGKATFAHWHISYDGQGNWQLRDNKMGVILEFHDDDYSFGLERAIDLIAENDW